jgi:hypothetical protein
MSKNKIIDYLSALHSVAESAVVDIEEGLSEIDDGQSYTVQEGKDAGVIHIQNIIHAFQKMRVDIENMSHKAFCAKYGITAD